MSRFSHKLRTGFFGFMRAIKPVLNLGKQVWVFRDEQVREILRRDQDFTLREINAHNIERRIGPFLLGMDDGPQYQHESGVLQKIIHRTDHARIQEFSRNTAEKLLQELPADKPFNLVRAFCRQVPLLFLGDYFGIPGPDEETMLKWNRSLFWDIFLNIKDLPAPRDAGARSASEMNPYLIDLIEKQQASLKAGDSFQDTLLIRLLKLQEEGKDCLDNDGIRRNLAGAFLGAVEPISKACVNILNQWLQRPGVFQKAQQAAAEDDREALSKLAFEAFRLHPNLPVIIRYAREEQIIGEEGKKQYRIKAGKQVYAFIASAMLDPRKFPQAHQILDNRPREDYLFFGHGIHACYGRYINYIMIPEMLMALLKLKNLRPVKGKKGKIQYEGTFPDEWWFTFG